MKKFILDLTVTENIRLNANYVLLKLTSQSLLPEMLPGQFAELRVDGSPTTFLRRPISINFVPNATPIFLINFLFAAVSCKVMRVKISLKVGIVSILILN